MVLILSSIQLSCWHFVMHLLSYVVKSAITNVFLMLKYSVIHNDITAVTTYGSADERVNGFLLRTTASSPR